ncbi:MAG: hypothetical protein BJ554DRAFT_3334 [Olpidium bornovanus]|uniref:Mediator of RNA polymerase II transcription subunit 31 n=1 Tax=Olpidium bornovanus TaxID=278681 RepID=A0A8H8DFR0_9FUNG|nr:MAG: hypothetical protein BJ554DRAFT_3334 [Olpidium bornovanus]
MKKKRYPHCLRMLGLLQHTSFREELGKHDTAAAIYQRQILHWRHWRYPRPAFSGAAAGAGAEAAPADVKAPSPGEEHVARNAVRGASLGARRKS